MVSGIFLLSAGTGYSPTYFTQNSKNKKKKTCCFFFRVKKKEMYIWSLIEIVRGHPSFSSMKSFLVNCTECVRYAHQNFRWVKNTHQVGMWLIKMVKKMLKKKDWHECVVVVRFFCRRRLHNGYTVYTKGHHLTGGLTRAPMYPWSSQQQPTLFFFFGFKLIQSNASACVLLSTYSWKDFK